MVAHYQGLSLIIVRKTLSYPYHYTRDFFVCQAKQFVEIRQRRILRLFNQKGEKVGEEKGLKIGGGQWLSLMIGIKSVNVKYFSQCRGKVISQ